MLKQPAQDRMTCINLSLDPLFQRAEVGADHVLNRLHSTFRTPIAGALSHSAELRDHLDQLFIGHRFTMAAHLDQSLLDGQANGWLLILLVYKLRDARVAEELGQAIDDRVVWSFGVTDRRKESMVRVEFADKAGKERLLRLAREAIVGNEDMDRAP